MSSLIRRTGPFAERNPRLYVLFTTFYNARAYYPVLAIFFTDLGLSLEQFVLLNLVWAAAIFLLEVPSGALADTLGRKRLLVFSAAVMVVEMAILLLAPKGGGALLFSLCVVNRLLSGASEAAASGADEAIAYDALPEEDRESAWDEVLGTAMRWRAAGFLVSMSLGGLLYDPSWWNRMVPQSFQLSEAIAHRLPVALVFLQGLACLAITLRLEEERPAEREGDSASRCRSAFRLTLQTARRAFTTRTIAVAIAGGLLVDSVVRNFATINSEYYRLIEVPDWAFGFIGSLIAVGGWFVPSIATRINQRFSTLGALALSAAITVACLFALAPAWPWFGLVPAVVSMNVMGLVGFTLGRFLHARAEASERATLLSVKGLAFNLGYGLYSLFFSLLLAGLKRGDPPGPVLPGALWWQAALFALVALAFFSWALRTRRAYSK